MNALASSVNIWGMNRPELTERPSGMHKQTYQERMSGLNAEIRQKMP